MATGGPVAGGVLSDGPDKINVLLIEDDPEDRQLTLDLLEQIGCRRLVLESVQSYEEGLAALLGSDRHDVALLDFRLGARDGIQLIREVISGGSMVPLILLTGQGDEEIEERALAAGAADYLVKGAIDAATLQRSIRLSIERGRALSSLFQRELQLNAFFQSALDAIVIADDDGRIVDANPAALSRVGATREELSSKRIHDFVLSSETEISGSWASFLDESIRAGEVSVRGAGGQRTTVEYRAAANVLPGRHVSILRDVTERRSADEARARLAAIVESSADAIMGFSSSGLIEYWSPSAERLYGLTADEVIGQHLSTLIPTDRHHEVELHERVRQGEIVLNYETTRQHKDGSAIEVSVTLFPTRVNGEIIGASAVVRDITEKKRLEAQLALADRMVSMGTLAAGVAHEINNPLAVVIANLGHIANVLQGVRPGADDAVRTDVALERNHSLLQASLDDAREASARIGAIVKDLKLFSRPDEQRRGAVNVATALESAVRMARNEIRHRAHLAMDLQPLPAVQGNEARLGQVFLNLLINAAQALDEGDAGNNEIRVATRTDAAGRVVVKISDTGNGIPPGIRERIFEPFYTTKAIGIGTGLGLSICQRIVHEHAGELTLASEVGVGTTFRVALPAMTAAAAAPLADRAPAHPPGSRRGRVLIVDDESAIGRALVRLLGGRHDVVFEISAVDALRRIQEGERYDVILCDIMMPQMTGVELYDDLSSAVPEQAAAMMFLTGGAFTAATQAFLDRVPNQRIDKPFDPAHVRGLVDARVQGGEVQGGEVQGGEAQGESP